jgi:two-component system repressor protein LuxO
MADPVILIVEDIASLALAYSAQLEAAGFACQTVSTGTEAVDLLSRPLNTIGAVLLDLQLPDMDGLSLMRAHPDLVERHPFIVATADGSITRAIEAMRLGAFDFLVKPLAAHRLITIMKSALETMPQHDVEAGTPVQPSSAQGYMGFIGMSPPMQTVYRQIANVARSRATVFITGESGTGKEVCAESIHKASPRAARPFIAINCGAIPEDLLESELFGHLKGSFTGAVSDRIGAVQAAHGGTLFLDEICEMEPKLQVKLLRFLQTGTIQRVGSSRIEEVDVRIICATNRNPEAEVAAGRFREDLYYRLAVVPLEMPPLRARGVDIAILANAFLKRYGEEEGKAFNPVSPVVIQALGQHLWPGNVRELQNLIRRAAVMHSGPDLPLDVIPRAALPIVAEPVMVAPVNARPTSSQPSMALLSSLTGLTLEEIERIAIENAIDQAGGSLPVAARMLGVSPSTLYRKRERWLTRSSVA